MFCGKMYAELWGLEANNMGDVGYDEFVVKMTLSGYVADCQGFKCCDIAMQSYYRYYYLHV